MGSFTPRGKSGAGIGIAAKLFPPGRRKAISARPEIMISEMLSHREKSGTTGKF